MDSQTRNNFNDQSIYIIFLLWINLGRDQTLYTLDTNKHIQEANNTVYKYIRNIRDKYKRK